MRGILCVALCALGACEKGSTVPTLQRPGGARATDVVVDVLASTHANEVHASASSATIEAAAVTLHDARVSMGVLTIMAPSVQLDRRRHMLTGHRVVVRAQGLTARGNRFELDVSDNRLRAVGIRVDIDMSAQLDDRGETEPNQLPVTSPEAVDHGVGYQGIRHTASPDAQRGPADLRPH